MTGFEPRVSGVGGNRSTNCATTTAQLSFYFKTMLWRCPTYLFCDNS